MIVAVITKGLFFVMDIFFHINRFYTSSFYEMSVERTTYKNMYTVQLLYQLNKIVAIIEFNF